MHIRHGSPVVLAIGTMKVVLVADAAAATERTSVVVCILDDKTGVAAICADCDESLSVARETCLRPMNHPRPSRLRHQVNLPNQQMTRTTVTIRNLQSKQEKPATTNVRISSPVGM